MRFLLSNPFTKVAGKELELPLSHPVSLRELIGRLPSELVKMIHHGDSISDVELCAHVMFFNKVRLLRLDDFINDADIVRVMLPPSGG